MHASTTKFCAEQPFVVPYLEFGVSIPTFMFFQSVLLVNTIHKEYKKNTYLHDVSPVVRISFIALQLCGLYWSIVDLLRFVIDPHTDLMQNNIMLCNIVAYSPKVIVIIYYGIYLHQILFRLDASFKDTCLELSKTTKYALYSLTYVPLLLIPPLFFAYLSPKCIWIWYPSDFPQWKHMSFCDAPMTKHSGIVMSCGIVWVGCANLLFCVIFANKLKRILTVRCRSGSGRSATSHHQFILKTVMIKNSILVSCASCFTIFNWILWYTIAAPSGFGATLLYFDILLNMTLVAMMFKYNDSYYRVLCKWCIKMCFRRCDQSYHQGNTDQIRIQLELYFKGVNLNKINSVQRSTVRRANDHCMTPVTSVVGSKSSNTDGVITPPFPSTPAPNNTPPGVDPTHQKVK